MENEDDVEGAEFRADDVEVEPNDHGIKEDAKFEDKEGGDLLFKGEPAGFCVAVFELFGETFNVFLYLDRHIRLRYNFSIFHASDDTLNVMLGAHIILDLNIALRFKVKEEDHYNRSQHNSWTPWILRPTSRHTYTGIRPYLVICGI